MSMDLPADTKSATKSLARRLNSPAFARGVALVMVTAAIAFTAGIWFASATESPHNDEDFEIFWQSWNVLEDEYYYELPEDEVMIRGALQGLLATTEDPYTFLAPPARAEISQQETAGEFGGIGAYVNQDSNGHLVITAPFNDYPAEAAGLETGDIIRTINGTDITGFTLDQAVALLRGEIGSTVSLTIFRPSTEEEFPVEITRAQIELPTVYATMYGEVGYVRLFKFNARATQLLESNISELVAEGAQALIFDLRGNPGGLLDQAVSVSDLFLDSGLVLTQRSRSGDNETFRSNDGQIAESLPLVVLIDGGSASASEVVAGALRDRGRAILIGTTSFGKGSVQHLYNLADGSQLHLTAALWFTPDETPIQGQGLSPDIQVQPAEDATAEQDPILQAALDYFEEHDVIESAAALTTAEPESE